MQLMSVLHQVYRSS